MENGNIASFVKDLMRRRKVVMSQIAADLGVSHSTVSRWISGEYMPNTHSCRRLAEYSGVPLSKILSLIDVVPTIDNQASAEWPEFKDYLRHKYPDVLDDDLIDMMEDIIEGRRRRGYGKKTS